MTVTAVGEVKRFVMHYGSCALVLALEARRNWKSVCRRLWRHISKRVRQVMLKVAEIVNGFPHHHRNHSRKKVTE